MSYAFDNRAGSGEESGTDDGLPRTEQFRFINLTENDPRAMLAVRAFFRRIGLSRVYDELVVPGLDEGSGMAVMAVRDRPWPPFGIGAHSVSALCFVYPIGEGRAGLANVFALPEEELSVGLLGAVYREALALLAERGVEHVHFVTREGAHLPAHVLSKVGFERTGIPYITDAARYTFFEAAISSHLAALGVNEMTPLQLVGDECSEAVLDRLSLFLLTVNAAFAAYWADTLSAPLLIPNTAVPRVSACNPPGGVPRKPRPK